MLRCARCQEPLIISGDQIIGQKPVSPICPDCMKLLAEVMEKFMRRDTFLVEGANAPGAWIDSSYFCKDCQELPKQGAQFCPACGKEKPADTPAEEG